MFAEVPARELTALHRRRSIPPNLSLSSRCGERLSIYLFLALD